MIEFLVITAVMWALCIAILAGFLLGTLAYHGPITLVISISCALILMMTRATFRFYKGIRHLQAKIQEIMDLIPKKDP